MKKIGIVGGVAWPSTVEYYRLICLWANQHFEKLGAGLPYPTPPMTIESVNISETRKLRAGPLDGDAEWAAFDAVFRDALLRLQHADCDFGLIANNTSHTRLHSIRKGLDMPVISIIDESAREAQSVGMGHALILGTSVTMRNEAYAEALKVKGIVPNSRLPEEEIDTFQQLIDVEFDQGGTIRGRKELVRFCHSHVTDPTDTAILLACTELPLAFPQYIEEPVFQSDGFTFINTSAVHIRAGLNRSLGL